MHQMVQYTRLISRRIWHTNPIPATMIINSKSKCDKFGRAGKTKKAKNVVVAVNITNNPHHKISKNKRLI